MAVDMSNVKQIMHNNKEVIKIEDSLGHIIWQKVPEQPYRRLEYLYFDGTNYCDSAEHNAYNRAFRLDFEQTGWNDRGLCYPFGIWTSASPNNILLIRNERSNTSTGFEVCRVRDTAFGQYPPETYMNQRIVAEMKWGSNTTISYRLRNQSSSDYIVNSSGTASGWNNNNNGNFFIGAINDGGGGSHSNANGMVVGKIYEVAIAGSNSFDDYGYAYVPCQRKSDGAIGFKQPHADFWPLRNKADGSIVTNISSHMGPVVDDNWDGVTYTIEPSPEPTYVPQWHTVWEGSLYCRGERNFWYSPAMNYTDGNGTVLYTVDTTTLPNPESIQCRVTFTGMGGSGTTTFTPSNKTSPYTITGINTAKTIIEAEGRSSNSAYYAYARLRITRSGNTSSFNISCYVRAASSGNNYGGVFTVKKLELYY